MELDHIIDYFSTFREWVFSQLYYSDEEYHYAVVLQRMFRRKMYLRRCKATQTVCTQTDPQLDQEWVF